MGRLQREGKYTRVEARNLLNRISQDCTNFDLIPLNSNQQSERVLEVTVALPIGVSTRTLDTIQLAAADTVREQINKLTPLPKFTFVTADTKLLRAAIAYGLVVENPENHP